MIQVRFERHGGEYAAVAVCGHAGFDDPGRDIVCAGVTSAVQLVVNGITEVLGLPADCQVGEGSISLRLPPRSRADASDWMRALYLHLGLLEEEYGAYINVVTVEV